MEALVLIGLMAVLAYLWGRLNRLQQRVELLESPGYHGRSEGAFEPPFYESPGQEPSQAPLQIDPLFAPAMSPWRQAIHPPVAQPPESEPVSGEAAVESPPAPPVEQPIGPHSGPWNEPFAEPAKTEVESISGFSFEDIFGRRLPIWGGGITLAVAGMLIVKYSIDAGLVSPLVRVISGLLFGTGLIAAAEIALRAENRLRDPRCARRLPAPVSPAFTARS